MRELFGVEEITLNRDNELFKFVDYYTHCRVYDKKDSVNKYILRSGLSNYLLESVNIDNEKYYVLYYNEIREQWLKEKEE